MQPLCLKTTSASEDEISHLLEISRVNVIAVLIYYMLFPYFTLSKMFLKQLLIASYGKDLYKQTSLLQQIKIKNAECGSKEPDDIFTTMHYHNITPKSF